MNIKILLAVLVFSTRQGIAQTAPEKVNKFSVAQALEYSKQHSVEIQNALLDIKIQEQTNRDVTSIALPQISSNAWMTDYLVIPTTLIPGEIAGQPVGTFVPVRFGTKWNSGIGFNFKQMLFDGQVFIALKARDGTMELSRKIAALTEEKIRENIYKIYYQLVISKTQVQLLDANIERLEKLHRDIQIMYDNGFTEKLDIDKISVQQTNLQSEKVSFNNTIQNGYLALKILMGLPVKDSLVLTDSISEDQVKQGILENSNDYKYSDRKDFQILEVTNRLNALNVRRYKLSQYPSLALVGNAGLQLNIPIFNGFSLRAKTEQARLELKKTQNQAEALKNSIDGQVNIARNNFATAISNMDFQRKNMALAEQVYDQTKKKYEIGTASTTDINNVQVDLKAAQTNFLTALYGAVIAKIDFFKAIGKL
jgi:outer membrane protein